jgi:hypothetical protein
MRSYLLMMIAVTVLAACNVQIGTLDENDPRRNQPGVHVGEFRITQTADNRPQYTLMTCTTVDRLRSQLNRVLPVQASTRWAEQAIRSNQIQHLRSWGCNERVIRGYPFLEWVGRYQSPSGQWFTLYEVWQREGRVTRAYSMGFTAR